VVKVKISLKRHSGEGRNPVTSANSGCRIKSGMTNSEFFAKSTKIFNEISYELSGFFNPER
jgi:hypothetical protein